MKITSKLKNLFKINGKKKTIDIKAEQFVTYKDYTRMGLVKGKVIRTFIVTDSVNKEDIGMKFAYVREDDVGIPYVVSFEDIVKVGE